MKIKQYQVGGGIAYLPTTSRSGAAAQQPAAASDSEGNSKVPGFAKEVISIVKENGLDSDVQVFLGQVGRILDVANDPTGENLTLREILKVRKLASQVHTNYEDYKKAEEKLNQQDAWGEMAIDSRGQIYVKDVEEGGLKTISPSEYDPEKYIALTNGDLLNIRRLDPTLAYRTDLLDSVGHAVGMNAIVEKALAVIKEFNKTTITGYTEKQSDKIKSGLQHIVSADIPMSELLAGGPDGVYKITSETTIADTGIREALNYLYTTMPNEYKNTLRAKAAVEGYNPDAMLLQMIYYDTPRSLKADYEKDASEMAGYVNLSAQKEPKEQLTEDNLAIRFAKGDLTRTVQYISPVAEHKSDRAQMAFMAWNGGRPQDISGRELDTNNLQDLLPQIFQLAGTDFSSMSFGNQTINGNDLATLVWDGTSNVNRVALPAKYVNGKMVPDFKTLEDLNKINEMIANNPGMTQLEINQELKKLESPGITYDEKTRQYTCSNIGFFATMGAYVNQELFDIKDESKPYLEHLSRPEGRQISDWYDKLVMYGKPNPGKSDRKKNDFESSEGNDFYYGNIYIAITDPMQATNVTKDQFWSKDIFRQVNERYRLGQEVAQGRGYSTWNTQTVQ